MDEAVSGEVLPPARVSVREVGFGGAAASALGRAGADAKAARREVLRSQVEDVLSGITREAAQFALDLVNEGRDELVAAKAANRYPDKDVMRRSERALDRWFDRMIGKPTQSMTVESKQDIWVFLNSVVNGGKDGGG